MLKINSITLHKFLGMWLNDIQHFELNDIKTYQLILGRNGCGKSRLLKIMGLAAPEKTDFIDGGYRVLKITFDDKQYTLRNDLIKSNLKCSIYCDTDSEQICENANPSVYNQFIKELFKYDKSIHQLLIGKVRFTELKLSERKHWFSLLSESDLTYALKYFNNAKANLRDINGAIKTTQFNIAELTPRVIEDGAEFERAKEQISTLEQKLAELDQKISELKVDRSITNYDLKQNDEQLRILNDFILKTDVRVSTTYASSNREQLNYEIARYTTIMQGANAKLHDLYKVIEHNQKIGNVDLDKLTTNLNEYEEQIAELRSQHYQFEYLINQLDDTRLSELLGTSLDHIQSILPDAIEAIAKQRGLSVTELHTKQSKCESSIAEHCLQLKSVVARTEYLHSAIEHIQGICDVSCPNCQHTFKPGVKIGSIDAAKAELESLSEREPQINEQLQLLNEELASVKEALRGYHSFELFTAKSHPIIDPLIKYLVEHDYLRNPNLTCRHLISNWCFEVKSAKEFITIVTTKDKLANFIEETRSKQQAIDDSVQAEYDAQLAVVDDCTEHLEQLKYILNLVSDTEDRIAKVNKAKDELANTLDARESIAIALADNAIYDLMQEERNTLSLLLRDVKLRHDQMDVSRTKLADMKESVVALENRKAAAMQVVDALSTDTGGILARHLYDAITIVTNNMTRLIAKIWGYDIVIKPCEIKDGEIDYKFPFYAESPDKLNADVSMASLGQAEVIDLVFVLTVYTALKLKGYPLFSDEIGKTFDEEHKSKMIQLMTSLIETGENSQLFMISHDPAIHFQLVNASSCVIDPTNVTLPAVYNENVIIEV